MSLFFHSGGLNCSHLTRCLWQMLDETEEWLMSTACVPPWVQKRWRRHVHSLLGLDVNGCLARTEKRLSGNLSDVLASLGKLGCQETLAKNGEQLLRSSFVRFTYLQSFQKFSILCIYIYFDSFSFTAALLSFCFVWSWIQLPLPENCLSTWILDEVRRKAFCLISYFGLILFNTHQYLNM